MVVAVRWDPNGKSGEIQPVTGQVGNTVLLPGDVRLDPWSEDPLEEGIQPTPALPENLHGQSGAWWLQSTELQESDRTEANAHKR